MVAQDFTNIYPVNPVSQSTSILTYTSFVSINNSY